MDERRRRLIAITDEQEYRVALMKELDFLEHRVGDKCEGRVADVLKAVNIGHEQQATAIDDLRKIAQSSVNGIQSLADALSVTISVEGAGKKVVETASNGVNTISRWAKIWAYIFVIGGMIWGLFHGQPPKG